MSLDKYETIVWCKGTPEIPCWLYGRTTHVKRSDGTYECARCKTIKSLEGIDHERQTKSNLQTAV